MPENRYTISLGEEVVARAVPRHYVMEFVDFLGEYYCKKDIPVTIRRQLMDNVNKSPQDCATGAGNEG